MRKYLMAGAATAALILGLNQVMAQSSIGGADKGPAASSQSAPAAPGGASTDVKRDHSKTIGQSQSRDEKSDLKAAPSSQLPAKTGTGASDELKKSDSAAKSKMTTGQAKDNAIEPSGKAEKKMEPAGKVDKKMTTGQSKDENRNAMEPGGKMEKGAQAPSSSTTKMGQQPSTSQNAQAPASSNTKMGQQPSTNQNSAQGTSSPGVTTGSTSSGSVQLTEQQRTEVREKVLVNAPRESNVNFALNLGIAVPRTVHVVAVPEVLIRIHPEWRRHRFFVVNDEIVIVDNDFRIIAIVPI
jgi:hypothetical protein